jgi:membrane dipeptidase
VFGAILHFEGADAIEPDLAFLRLSYALGLRSLGLTWSRPNAFAQGVGPDDTEQGLTEAGKRLVHGCNDLGVLIDVSHLNDAGFCDVLKTSSKPIVASHSNCRALSPHPRNLTDDQIRALAANGGLLGLNFAVRFLWPDMAARTDLPLDRMVDHIEHVVNLVGIEHVALGTDYDGTQVPNAVSDAGKVQALVGRLRERGFDDEQVAAICHGNWLRVLRAVWR